MHLYDRLNNFINSDTKHAFLLYGPWGSGKTYLMDKWLKNLSAGNKYKKKYEIIKLSLFGISNVSELNILALNSETFKNRFINKYKKLDQNVSLGACGITIQLPLNGIISSFLEEKHGKDNYLFVLDDIERKDNKLSMEELFGFVDTLPTKNTKVILIANLDKMIDKNDFKRFKEKVIQDDYYLELPETKAIENIIGKKYSHLFANAKLPPKNLRTLIKCKEVIDNLENNVEDNLVMCIYYCYLNILEGYYSKEDLINNLKAHEYYLLETSLNQNQNETLENKINKYIGNFSQEWQFLCENIRILNLLPNIEENELENLVKNVYVSLVNYDFSNLMSIKIHLRPKALKKCDEYGNSVFFSKNPNKEYESIMIKFEELFKSGEYNLFELFARNFYVTIEKNKNYVSINSRGKKIEKRIIENCPPLIAKYIFYHQNGNYRSIYEFILLTNIADWAIEVNKKTNSEYLRLINCHYLSQSKISEKMDFDTFKKRLYVAEKYSKETKIDIKDYIMADNICKNLILNSKNYLMGDVKIEDFEYVDNVFSLIHDFKINNYVLTKTLDIIKNYASINSIFGKRVKLLNKKWLI